MTDPRIVLDVLTPEDVALVHQETLDVLASTGVDVEDEEAWDIHGDGGCTVEDREARGATDLYERARQRALELLEVHKPDPLDAVVAAGMRRVVDQADRLAVA